MRQIIATFLTTTTGVGPGTASGPATMVVSNGRATLCVTGIADGAAGTVKLQYRAAGDSDFDWADAASVTTDSITSVGPFAGGIEYRINCSAHAGTGQIKVIAFGQDEMR